MDNDDDVRWTWIRHGQGIHNAAYFALGKRVWDEQECVKPAYRDAALNEIGRAQCLEELRPKLLGLDFDCIVVSPLTRALETAELGLDQWWGKVPTIAVELIRERFGVHTCNQRSPVSSLRERFPTVDFGARMSGTELDTWHSPTHRESDEEVQVRSREFLRWLQTLPHKRIAIVGHADFMEQTFKLLQVSHPKLSNCAVVTSSMVRCKI